MATVINYNFDKKKAIQICKKEVSGKFAIIKDEGDFLKVGTPPFMMANITIKDNTIEIDGSGLGAPIASTCASSIQVAVEEYQESLVNQPPASAPASPQPAPQPALTQSGNVTVVAPSKEPNHNQSIKNELLYLEALEKYYDLKQKGVVPAKFFEEKKKNILEELKKIKYEGDKEVESAPAAISAPTPANEPEPVTEEKQPEQTVEEETNTSAEETHKAIMDSFNILDRVVLTEDFTVDDTKIEKGSRGTVQNVLLGYGRRMVLVSFDRIPGETFKIPEDYFEIVKK